MLSGEVIDAVIDSERMTHSMCAMGYECYPKGDPKDRFFADGKRIIGWDGRCETKADLDKIMKQHG